MAPRLILASASPRRKQLLEQIQIVPDAIIPADVDETPLKDELPRDYCLRVAAAKAQVISADNPDAVVLGSDTVVACGRRILPKTEQRDEAEQCLRLLSGRRHRVLTAVVVQHGEVCQQRSVETVVAFKRLSKDEITHYLASNEWQGKAGGYAIQGQAACYVKWMRGSYSAVVGLPLHETYQLLATAGIAPRLTE